MIGGVRAIGPGLGLIGLALLGLALLGAKAPGWNWHLPPGIAPPSVPADNPMSAAKVELGRRLFYDADLSADGTMSCASCHEQRHGFADGNRTRPGVTGEPGRRNVPGLANVAWFEPLTFADPAQVTLEAQVSVPVLGTHPVEMGMAGREPEIAARLSRDPCYRTMFAEAFPKDAGRIDIGNTAKAIASFERTLISLGSAYDRGELSPEARAGRAVFVRGCSSCHQGRLFTDLKYHRISAQDADATDAGLSETTRRADDRGRFRTPSLRNVALSAPYWHDGASATLTDAAFITDPRHALPATACGRAL